MSVMDREVKPCLLRVLKEVGDNVWVVGVTELVVRDGPIWPSEKYDVGSLMGKCAGVSLDHFSILYHVRSRK